MKLTSMNMLLSLNLTGSLVVMSSSSWFSIWMGMELSSLSAPAMIMMANSSLISKINSWKYFMIQCYSSTIFFFCIIALSSSSLSTHSNPIWLMIIFSMLLKMGILPFHGWFYHLALSVPWMLLLILSTIQKIGPILVISECTKAIAQSLQPDLLTSSVISALSISTLKINSIRHFMITSSIINTMWILSSAQVSKVSFIIFLIFYFLHLTILFLSLSKEFNNSMESSFFSWKKSFSTELMKTLVILSMMGIPPLLGFFMKMSIVEQLMANNQLMSMMSLLASSSIIMLMYLKMTTSTISNMRMEDLKQFKSYKLLPLSVILLSSSLFYTSI